jgi:glycosyltransferase involved in cell wall biosynthesis
MAKAARHRIFLLDTEVQTHNRYIALSIRAALAERPDVEIATLGEHGTAVRDFIAGRHDFFLAFGGAGHHAPLLARLCALARFSVLWTTEDPYERAVNVEFSRPFDAVFSNDRASLPAYGGRARHLPLAASELFNDFPVREDDGQYRYDLLFIGTAWPNRVAMLNDILRHCRQGLRAKIGLSRNEFLAPARLLDADLIADWRCSNRDFARLANASRVVLSLPRRFSAAAEAEASGSTPPPRLFEVALAGAFQVCVGDGGEAAGYFEDGAEIDFCRDAGEAARAIERALADPLSRIAKARAARTRALAEHCYRHRVAEIVAAAPAPAPRARPATPRRAAKTVLVVTHNLLGHAPGGGIEIYQEELKRLPSAYRPLYLFPAAQGEERALRVMGAGPPQDYPLAAPVGRYDLTNPEVEAVFERILFEHRVDLVHFQHLLHYPLSLPLIARACGVPSVWTLHDYYLVCQRYNLLDFEGRFCDVARKTPEHCDICLTAQSGLPNGAQSRRRNFVATVAAAFDAIVASTAYSRDYFRAMFPEAADDRLAVVEMLMPDRGDAAPRRRARPEAAADRPLQVAVPGNFTDVKGGHYLIRLFNMTREWEVRYTLLGRVDEPLARIIGELRLPNVTARNGYRQEDIAAILAEFDVSLHVSLWPETYMISLSEAWAAGLLPIVTDLGAQGERVTDGVDGFKVAPHDAAAIAGCLRRILLGAAPLAAMRAAIAKKRPMTTRDHLAALGALYDRLTAARPLPHLDYPIRYRQRFTLDAFACGIRLNAARWDRIEVAWDEPLPPPAAEAASTEASPGAALLDALPRQYAHLARRDGAGEAGLRLEIDEIEPDDCRAGRRPRRLRAARSLRLAGWMHVPNSVHVAFFFRLRSAVVDALVAAPIKSRPDVADHAGDRTAERSGFDGRIELAPLPEATYRIGLVGVFEGFVVDIDELLELEVSGAPAAAVAPPPEPADIFDVAAFAATPRTLPVTMATPELLFYLDAVEPGGAGNGHAEGEGLVVKGWMFHRGLGAPRHFALAWREEGRPRSRRIAARARPDVAETYDLPEARNSGFEAWLPAAALADGEALLFQVYDETTLLFADFLAVVRAVHQAEARPAAALAPAAD